MYDYHIAPLCNATGIDIRYIASAYTHTSHCSSPMFKLLFQSPLSLPQFLLGVLKRNGLKLGRPDRTVQNATDQFELLSLTTHEY